MKELVLARLVAMLKEKEEAKSNAQSGSPAYDSRDVSRLMDDIMALRVAIACVDR